MKRYYSILLIAFAVMTTACDPDYEVSDYFDLEELPGYVAFDADGNNARIDDVETDENGGTTELIIENPTGTLSDITVNYALSGTAMFGTDYTIEGASAAGGSLTIVPNSGAVNETARVTLTITLLTDDVADGEKTITVSLSDASNAEGTIAVGRGGTDFLKVANVIIADVD
ncbi:MAG: hypothetical protein AAF696_10875 [Bacteroidota bacterium]